MKYSEAKKQVKALSSNYDINMDDEDFNIVYDGSIRSIYVGDDCQYNLNIGNHNTFSNMPFSEKLYMILAELAMTPLDERVEEKKYQVKVFGDYLNVPVGDLHPFLFYGGETEKVKTCFTLNEIEELKKRDDVPLDWNKIVLEEAE